MKKESLLKKFNAQVDKIQDCIDEISNLLEIENEDEELSEMSVIFREQIETCLTENEECNVNDIIEYMRGNL
jgi:flagellin-specific chaperone FliS